MLGLVACSFFFLSNDEMLEILSETKDPTRVQPHLKKCFEGISKLTFTDSLAISRMASVEGESVAFKTLVDTARAHGSVEKWLVEVESSMFESVHAAVAQGLAVYPAQKRHEWVLQWPGMVVLVVTAIFWTQGASTALVGNTTQTYADQCTCAPPPCVLAITACHSAPWCLCLWCYEIYGEHH
jgi:dynein heavy chain, axonemal